jgi:hypothetical protein
MVMLAERRQGFDMGLLDKTNPKATLGNRV